MIITYSAVFIRLCIINISYITLILCIFYKRKITDPKNRIFEMSIKDVCNRKANTGTFIDIKVDTNKR